MGVQDPIQPAQPNAAAPAPPDLAGYSTPEQLAAGYRASSAEAQRLKAENESMRRQYETLAANPRQDVPRRKSPIETLAEIGLPEVAEAVTQLVGEAVAQVLSPVTKGFEARNQMLVRYPEYGQFEPQVLSYIGQDAQASEVYQRIAAVDPEAAMEYAYMKFGESKRRAMPANGRDPAAQSEAQIPTGPAGPRQPATGDQELIAQAFEHFQKTGRPEPYAKARLRTVITDEFLNQ